MIGNSHKLAVILLCTFALACLPAKAQNAGDTSEKEPSQGIFAVKTNLVEWTVAIPNISVFTDLSKKPWNRSVAGITIKYKWKTREAYMPSFILDLFEVRPEYRYYLGRLYFGGYASYDAFSIKLPAWEAGWQGMAWGGGASAGYEIPLYRYRKSALDLELGASLGAHYTNRQDFTSSEDGTESVYQEELIKKVLPYPELRVALVWRRTSIQDKYTGTDPMKRIFDREAEAIQINYNVTNRDGFDDMHNYRLKVDQNSVFLDLYRGNQEVYRSDFEAYVKESFVNIALDNIERSSLDEKSKKKLIRRVEALERKAMADFDKTLKEELRAMELEAK